MIILKQHVAAKRRDVHNGEALARIRERRGREEAATKRAEAWRAATRQLDEEHKRISWELREEEAQAQVQEAMYKRTLDVLDKGVKNRMRTAKAEERLRLIQERRELEKQDMIAEAEAKSWLANYRLIENEKQTIQKLDDMEMKMDDEHARVLERKAHIDLARAEHYALEYDVGEARRNAGAERVQLMRDQAHEILVKENQERVERFKSHAELMPLLDEQWRRSVEADLAERFETADIRRNQMALELRDALAHQADARELATAACQERKETLYRIAHDAKVEQVVARDRLGQMSVDFRRAELEEKRLQMAIYTEEAQNSARARRLEEKEDGHLQALVDMEEAKEILESYAIDIDVVGLKVEGNKNLALENSLIGHEERAKRLMDHCSVDDMRLVDFDESAVPMPLSQGVN